MDLIIQIRRFTTGDRRITRITEVIERPETLDYVLNDIFRYEVDPQNPTKGWFRKVGQLSENMKRKLIYYGVPEKEIQGM